jgi:hypothetical protein
MHRIHIYSHKNEALTKVLDKIYAEEKSEIDLVIDLMQLRSLQKVSW